MKRKTNISRTTSIQSIAIFGDKDPYFDQFLLSGIPANTFRVKIIPGAAHILEAENDIALSIENLKTAVMWTEEEIISFIGNDTLL